MKTVTVDGGHLTIDDVCAVAYGKTAVSFPENDTFFETLRRSRKFLEDYIAKGFPTYGVTTGFGDSCGNQINPYARQSCKSPSCAFTASGSVKSSRMKKGAPSYCAD